MRNEELRETYGNLFALMDRYFDPESTDICARALDAAHSALEGRTRYDGSPLVLHSVGCAEILISEIGLGRNSTIAALLHDVQRLGLISDTEIAERFGETAMQIITGMSRISSIRTKVSQSQVENFRDLIVSYSTETDPRVILLKLADRLEVMRALEMFPDGKRRMKSWESINIYAQIAHKLGLYPIKGEFEDLALRYLEPEAYSEIQSKLAESASERENLTQEFLQPIERKLREVGIDYHIKSRTKSVYSIWKKMRRQGIPFEEVYDVSAIRIIVSCPPEKEKMCCWGVFSIVTDFYTPNPDRMRDWISIPKSSGYESLHITVVTPAGRWVEVQIRTERMDEVAERGIAAHWRYKGVNQGSSGASEWLGRLRELIEDNASDVSIGKSLVNRSGGDEIFVFTPGGDLRKMPEGATVLDFAFEIHTNLGRTCTGARIKGKNVSIREKLHNGDIVHVITSKNQKPKTDWLSYVVTSRARSKIRICLREEQTKLARLGREELERKLRNWKINVPIDDAVAILLKHFRLRNGMDVYSRVAEQKIDLAEIKEVLSRPAQPAQEPVQKPPVAKESASQAQKDRTEDAGAAQALVIDGGISSLEYKLAKCCNPIMGDDIFGFTTVSSGITVHRSDCPNARRLREMYPYRMIGVKWRSKISGKFIASIRVEALDTPGILNRIMECVTETLRLNVRSMSLSPAKDGRVAGTINVEVNGSNTAESVVHTLMKLRDVEKVHRITT